MNTFHRTSSWPLNISNLVNLDHSLAVGLVDWFLVVPELSGGNTWYSVSSLNPGTLTNMAAGSGWSGTMRPGGFGSLLFDGVDDYIPITNNIPSTGFTVMMWAQQTNTLSGSFPAILSADNTNIHIGLNSTNPFFQLRPGGVTKSVTGSATVGTGWNHWAMTQSATAGIEGFFNGISQGTNGTATGSTTLTNLTIGRQGSSASWMWGGGIDDVRVYNRVLSAKEIKQQYDECLMGYPGLLNRTRLIYHIPPPPPVVIRNLLIRQAVNRSSTY